MQKKDPEFQINELYNDWFEMKKKLYQVYVGRAKYYVRIDDPIALANWVSLINTFYIIIVYMAKPCIL